MRGLCRALAVALLLPCSVAAQVDMDGYPWGEDGQPYHEERDTHNPLGQIVSGVVERCEVVPQVSMLNIVETWTCSAGTSNHYGTATNISGTTTNLVPYTNTYPIYTNIVVTNQVGPFQYKYTDTGGVERTGTSYPPVTRGFLHSLDSKIEQLIPYFVCTNEAGGDGNVSSYLVRSKGTGIYYPTDMPMESMAGLFARNNLGYSTNLTVDSWGHTNGGSAWWTRTPAITSHWPLAAAHYTGTWVQTSIGDFDTRYYEWDERPVLEYTSAGTNPLSSLSVTVAGLVLNMTNQTTASDSEVVVVTSSNTPLTLPFFRVTSITPAAAPPNTGDLFVAAWTSSVPLFGSQPYRLYVTDMNERAKVLSMLMWTRMVMLAPAGSPSEYRSVRGGPDNDIDVAYDENVADWPGSSWGTDTLYTNYWYHAYCYWGTWDNPGIYIADSRRRRTLPDPTNIIPDSVACEIDVFLEIENYLLDGFTDLNQTGSSNEGYRIIWYDQTWSSRAATTRGGAADSATYFGDYSENPLTLAGLTEETESTIRAPRMWWVLKWDFTHQ